MDISNDNYGAPWKLLIEGFDNKKVIEWNHMHKFFKITAAKEERLSAIKKNFFNFFFFQKLEALGTPKRTPKVDTLRANEAIACVLLPKGSLE